MSQRASEHAGAAFYQPDLGLVETENRASPGSLLSIDTVAETVAALMG